MSNNQTTAKQSATTSSKKLSPELSEFLHMLDALEQQISPRPAPSLSTR
jgi:hypothetical protein